MNPIGLPPAAQLRGHRFQILDLMRGIAAISVLINHSGNLLDFHMPSAYLAVDLFFLLSGFVIAHNYDKKIAEGMSFTDFMVQRLIRLYPCLLLTLLLGVLVFALRMSRDTGYLDGWRVFAAAGLNALFLPAIVKPWAFPSFYPFDPSAWSLTFELGANLLYWITFRRMTGLRLGMIVVLAGVGIAIAARGFGHVDLGMRVEDFWWGIPRVTLSFFIGVALRRYFLERLPYTLEAGAAPLVLCSLPLFFSLPFFISPGLLPLVEVLTVAAVFPLLILVVARASPGPGMAAICKWSGDASYPVYLLQTPFMGVLAALSQLFLGKRASELVPWFGLAHVLGTIGLALCIDRFYELPIRKKLKVRWQHRMEG